MHTVLRITVAVLVLSLLAATAEAKKAQVIRAAGGTNVPSIGLVIDASYDPRLDTLIPGYKVIDVALVNQSFGILYLDPENDRWRIKLAGDGKTITAVHDLRRVDPKAWAALPDRAKPLLS